MPDKKYNFAYQNTDYKKILLLGIIIIFLLAILYFGFADAFMKLIERYDNTKPESQSQTPIVEPQGKKGETQLDLAKGPDWWIIYSVPTCFQKPNAETYDEMGAARIHFLKGKTGEITGVSLSGDTKIRFSGTFDGQRLELDDKDFFEGGNPIKLSLALGDDGKQMSGTYKTILSSDAHYIGCTTGEEIQGKATASICKNIDGKGCP